VPFWHFNDPAHWLDYFRQFSNYKPSHGLCAIFCAIDRGYRDIGLIGFDRLLHPAQETGKWSGEPWADSTHDAKGEHRGLMALDINLTDLVKHGETHSEAAQEAAGQILCATG
jgi:hypothetical protein